MCHVKADFHGLAVFAFGCLDLMSEMGMEARAAVLIRSIDEAERRIGRAEHELEVAVELLRVHELAWQDLERCRRDECRARASGNGLSRGVLALGESGRAGDGVPAVTPALVLVIEGSFARMDETVFLGAANRGLLLAALRRGMNATREERCMVLVLRTRAMHLRADARRARIDAARVEAAAALVHNCTGLRFARRLLEMLGGGDLLAATCQGRGAPQ